MTDVKISALPEDTSLDGTEVAPIAQSGATRRVSLATLRTWVRDGLTLAWSSITGTPTTLAGYGITDAASDAELAAHEADTTNVHGIADTSALVLTGDSRLSNARTPTGAAGGVLSGTYPNPGFAADMATQAELDAVANAKLNIPAHQTLTDQASIAWDVAGGPMATVTLGGNRTLALPSNIAPGGTYLLRVVQDATGGRTLAYGTGITWLTGSPTLSSGANKTTVLSFACFTSGALIGVAAVAEP